MNRRIVELYDEYTHEGLLRRDFLARLARLAGGAATANLMYDGVDHAFHNDTNAARYNAAAAALAWQRTVEFLCRELA